MTDVRSSAAQELQKSIARRGIATVWVEADSANTALQRGREVIDSRHYGRTGRLTLFREENTHVDSDEPIEPLDDVAAGYTALKAEALKHWDGLFELWFPAASH